MNEQQVVGSITFAPPAPKPSVAQLEYEITNLKQQLAAARKWYDAEYPAEDGHDQVYPWDHA